MAYSTVIVAALLAVLAGSASARQSPPALYITTEQSPPASMLDGDKIVGSTTDKVREIMARTGTSYSLDLLPWKRAYTAALTRTDACVYSTTRTAEREKLFKWVGPTDQGDWILFARADHKFTLNTLEDARALRIGTYNGDARDEFLRSRGFHVEAVQDELANPRKLMMNRIDLWAGSMRHGNTGLGKYGFGGKIVPVLVFNRIQVYLACNPGVPDKLIHAMSAALEAMTRDGTVKKIENKYENWKATP